MGYTYLYKLCKMYTGYMYTCHTQHMHIILYYSHTVILSYTHAYMHMRTHACTCTHTCPLPNMGHMTFQKRMEQRTAPTDYHTTSAHLDYDYRQWSWHSFTETRGPIVNPPTACASNIYWEGLLELPLL